MKVTSRFREMAEANAVLVLVEEVEEVEAAAAAPLPPPPLRSLASGPAAEERAGKVVVVGL